MQVLLAALMAAARAGDTALAGPGRYAEELRTVRPGRPGAPVRIAGRPGAHLVGPRGLGRVRFDLARGAKNGEAIYVGTAPEQSGGRPDRSDGNRVHHNRIAATVSRSTGGRPTPTTASAEAPPTARKGTAGPFLTGNRVVGNPARERVRVEGHPRPTG